MWKALGDFFKDPRLRQLFGRYATYYGSDPFTAPATLNLIAHVEQCGVWTVDGGMFALAQALSRVARGLGVEIRCGAEVVEVEGGQGVRGAAGGRRSRSRRTR
jgi:1-hydroxycarotenoid 3,4-desaturase